MPKQDDYISEAHGDLYFKQTEIPEYSISIGLKIQKWARYLYFEEKEKDKLENLMLEVYKNRYHYYVFDYEYQIDKKSIDTYVKGDKEYIQAREAFLSQEKLCKFIQNILNALERQSYMINNAIKMLEYQAGN